MLKHIITISLLLLCATAFAQERIVVGAVSSGQDRISGAIIHNLRSNARTISDTRGMFAIKASKGDTLTVDDITYASEKFVVGDDDNILITLKPSSRTLKQVDIHDSVPDPLRKFNQNKKEYAEIYAKGDKSHIVSFPVTMYPIPMAGIAINVDKIYNALSKQGRDARRLQRDFVMDYHDDIIDKRFTKKLVQRITGYDGKRLDDFMIANRPTYDFMKDASDYDLYAYIKNKFTLEQQQPFSDSKTSLASKRSGD
jgi:hypothetical protein